MLSFKVLVPGMTQLRSVKFFRMWGRMEGLDHWTLSLEGTVGHCFLPLAMKWSQITSLVLSSLTITLCLYRTKTKQSTSQGLKSPKPWAKLSASSFQLIHHGKPASTGNRTELTSGLPIGTRPNSTNVRYEISWPWLLKSQLRSTLTP